LLSLIGVVFLGAAVLGWARRFVAVHATAITLTAIAAVAVAVVVGVLVIRARLRQAAQQAERDRNIAVTDGMTGPLFEQYVARLMRRDGLRRVQVCGGSGDLGADVVAYTEDDRKVVVQCKRYAGSVGDPHVQKFNGTARQIHGADVALSCDHGPAHGQGQTARPAVRDRPGRPGRACRVGHRRHPACRTLGTGQAGSLDRRADR